MIARLHARIAAVCPIVGVAGSQGDIRVDYAPGATPQQQAAAQDALAAFDWSQAAQDAWDAARVPERKDLRDAAAQAIADLDTFLALAAPTQAQTLAIVRKLCQQNKRIIARLIQVD